MFKRKEKRVGSRILLSGNFFWVEESPEAIDKMLPKYSSDNYITLHYMDGPRKGEGIDVIKKHIAAKEPRKYTVKV